MGYREKFDLEHYFFQDTSFDHLMKRRIQHVLLICSYYDAFILEEDGRINETIFEEYVSLNLRYPPAFIQVHSGRQALEMLDKERFDLVINMLSINDVDPFALNDLIKQKYPQIPIVILTPFSKEVSQKLMTHQLSSVDQIFCWLGNPNILLAIIKLIEDKMNAHHDIRQIGVQAIILIEDSVRYYSSYLPTMYRILFEQSQLFMTEGLNEHQRMLRMRGRPKILLATSFEQAISYYEIYKSNILGIISDVTFKSGGTKDALAGVKFCQIVRSQDPQLPILLQSSDLSNKKYADQLGVQFLYKYSKTLHQELIQFFRHYLSFGDFIVIDPVTGEEIMRAGDLASLQEIIYKIPDRSLKYSIERNHFSRWLRARALFSLADLFRRARSQDFKNLDEVREFLYDSIARYRAQRSRGIIATFDRETYNPYLIVSRLGKGNLGGKGRGIAFLDHIIKKYNLTNSYAGVEVSIPRTVILTTDYFVRFMEENDLFQWAAQEKNDEVIFQKFLSCPLSSELKDDFMKILDVFQKPLAIRSSSLLEDSYYQPFAGIYSTYLIPNTGTFEQRLHNLEQAIKAVYASVYYQGSKSYITATSNVIDEEKMAVVIQEVSGCQWKQYFFPYLSGVARSLNFYPLEGERSDEGILNVALGLGKYIVDGGLSLRISPVHPEKAIQLSTKELMLRETQKEFLAIDLSNYQVNFSVDDSAQLSRLKVRDMLESPIVRKAVTTYSVQEDMFSELTFYSANGIPVVSFNYIFKYHKIPLANVMYDILKKSEFEMGKPVEIEFSLQFDGINTDNVILHLLQIRPIVDNKELVHIDLNSVNQGCCLIFSPSALGNGVYENIRDVIYVKPSSFDPSRTQEMVALIDKINQHFVQRKRNYVLIGPGRWGTSDPWLGIPVKWPHVSAAKVIVETSLEKYQIDPSQGTHFFQNLTSFRVAYMTINPFQKKGWIDYTFLEQCEVRYEDEFIRHVQFNEPIEIIIDGKESVGVITKPGQKISYKSDI